MLPLTQPDPYRIVSTADRVLVVASPQRALDLLRWATLRSDDILFVAEMMDAAAERFASRFAIETARRPFRESDLDAASAVLLSLGDIEQENRIVRSARRMGVALHVHDRPLVSDFTVLAMLEQPRLKTLAA